MEQMNNDDIAINNGRKNRPSGWHWIAICVIISIYHWSCRRSKPESVTRMSDQEIGNQATATGAPPHLWNMPINSPNSIQADNASCHLDTFGEYYGNHFFKSAMVPFDSRCLKKLIQLHPSNLDLRVAHVRRQYFERLSGPFSSPTKHNHMHSRHMIWYCRGNGCGGHGDRLRGMARVFYYALAFNATFSIFAEYPRWDDFFELLDDLELIGRQSLFHSLVLDDVIGGTSSDKYDYMFNTSRLPPDRTVSLSEMDYYGSSIHDYESALFPAININGAQYAVFETNQFLNFGEGGANVKRSNPFCNVLGLNDYAITDDLHFAHLYYIFLQLFASKPSFALSSEILKLKNEMSQTYVVGIHIRLGGPDVGDLGYRHSTTVIPQMVKVGKRLCNLHSLTYNSTAGKEGVTCSFLTVSDNFGATEKVKEELNGSSVGMMTPRGNVIHIDHRDPVLWQSSGPGTNADELKMFADWYLLGKKSDALVLSRSGFSLTAALLKSNGTSLNYRPVYVVDEASGDAVRLFDNLLLLNGFDDWGLHMTIVG